MCDQDTLHDSTEHLNTNEVSRRRFMTLSAGGAAGMSLATLLPSVANAQTVTETDVNITTPDGVADCYFV